MVRALSECAGASDYFKAISLAAKSHNMDLIKQLVEWHDGSK